MKEDMKLMLEAISHYENLGYFYMDTPWSVEEKAIKATAPKFAKCIKLKNNTYLVGSAEQSFIHCKLNNKFANIKSCSATPCFRDEYDGKFHLPYFFKLELFIDLSGVNNDKKFLEQQLSNITNDAYSLFKKITKGHNVKIEKVKLKAEDSGLCTHLLDETYDININGIEVGSYGIRNYENISWCYGTGLALPRLNTILSLGNKL